MDEQSKISLKLFPPGLLGVRNPLENLSVAFLPSTPSRCHENLHEHATGPAHRPCVNQVQPIASGAPTHAKGNQQLILNGQRKKRCSTVSSRLSWQSAHLSPSPTLQCRLLSIFFVFTLSANRSQVNTFIFIIHLDFQIHLKASSEVSSQKQCLQYFAAEYWPPQQHNHSSLVFHVRGGRCSRILQILDLLFGLLQRGR